MYVHATSILPTAPGKHNDPVWKFTNALVKKLAKNRIKEESAEKAPKVRRALAATFRKTRTPKKQTKQVNRTTHKQAKNVPKKANLTVLFPMMKSNQPSIQKPPPSKKRGQNKV